MEPRSWLLACNREWLSGAEGPLRPSHGPDASDSALPVTGEATAALFINLKYELSL